MMMIRLAASLTAVLSAIAASAQETPEDAAMRVLEEFMATFNARDGEGMAATLNYPHIRIASGTVEIDETAEEFASEMDFDVFAERFDWDHSAWGERTIIQSGEDKVHIAVEFMRYDKEGTVNATFKSLYIVTKVDGHWGVQARSSFAP